jgi:hypothetical protein
MTTLTSRWVDHPIPKGKFATETTGGIDGLVEQEMLGAAKAIEATMQCLQQPMARSRVSGRSVGRGPASAQVALAIPVRGTRDHERNRA